ncbi:MAG: hypothetical protein AB8B99_12610 [Phormidesmis sp.]
MSRISLSAQPFPGGGQKLYLGMTPYEWGIYGLPLTVIVLLVSGFVPQAAVWPTIGIGFSVFVCIHLVVTSNRHIVFPGLAAFVSCIQLIIAPFLSYAYPPVSKGLQFGTMAVDMDAYFSFAVPATVALWLGLHLSMGRRSDSQHLLGVVRPLDPQEKKFMDGLILLGSILTIVPISLGFFIYILTQLRFVGLLSWLLTRTKGWQWRFLVVFSSLLLQVVASGVFYELVLWSAFTLIILAHVQKWNWKLIPIILILITALVLINNVKADFRNQTVSESLTPLDKLFVLGGLVKENMLSTNKQIYLESDNYLGDKLVRYNQGWIVSRVIARVPDIQPYGYGETLSSALQDALLPRFLQPDNKGAQANSLEQFRKYTGFNIRGVSMGLGLLGEAFANFGRKGGIAMVFVYGACIGYLFSFITQLAADRSILWLSWLPFILLTALQAEWGMTLIINSITKSLYVAVVLIYFLPFLKSRLLKPKNLKNGEYSL